MAHHLWGDLKARELSALVDDRTVALLPIGAIEQHGPHLPLNTDAVLAECIATDTAALVEGATILQLPCFAIAKSDEHTGFAGMLSFDAATLQAMLMQIGRSLHASGIRRLVILNAHGGNVPVLQLAARALRIELGMFCVVAGWMSMGVPEGLLPASEAADGIHGGLVETAAMLHYRPDLVDMSYAKNFVPASRKVMEENQILRITGPVGAGWTMADLHPEGAAGNAALASTDIGRQLIEHAVKRYAVLLQEVADYTIPFESDVA